MKKKFTAVFLLICLLTTMLPAGLSALAASQTVYVISNTLPVYKSYSTSSGVLGTMSYGESMTCMATNNGWAYVKNSSGQTGYCKTGGLSNVNPNKYSEKIYINASGVKVYRRPDTGSSVMMTLSKNSSYTAVAITPDKTWARLKNGSAYGYVQMKYISTSKVSDGSGTAPDLKTGTVYISANTLTAYKSASTSSKSLGVMSYGDSMTLLATSGEWAQIRNSSGAVGYCKISGLTAANPNNLNLTVYIKQGGAKIYSKPSTSSSTVMSAGLNDIFTAVAITSDSAWARLKSGSNYAYVQTANLSTTPVDGGQETPDLPFGMTVYVVSNTLPVYASASASAKLLGTMSMGESMALVSLYDETWAQVRNSSGTVGYCLIEGLSTEDPNILNLPIYILETGARLYSKPLTSSKVLATLKQNAQYTAVTITLDGEWLRLKYGSSYGYLQTEYASVDEVDPGVPDVPQGTVYIANNTLIAYASPTTSAKSLGTMSYGESMLLLDVDDGWARIQNSSGAIGYCMYGGLTSVNPNNLNATMYAQSNGVKLYSKPLTTATVSKTANINDALTVVAITTDGVWARVSLGAGKYAYAQTASIADTKQTVDDSGIQDISKKTVYISATTLAVYASTSTSSKSLGTMSFGESLTCTGTNSTWARVVNSSGAVGYCKLSGITDTNPNSYNVTMYAQSSGVKVYKKASTSSSVITTVGLNAKVTGVAINADKTWIRLKNGSEYGYVQAGYFSTTPYGNGSSGGGSSSSTVDKVIALAKAQSGKPYIYGTNGPNSFDCSGFTYYVFRNAAGITLKRTSESQGYDSSYTKISSISSLKVGDLVFFNTNSNDADLCDHVGIYLGSNNFIHASSAGGKVITSNLSSGYYNRTFSWGRRVL